MQVLIMGGTQFISSAIAKHLISKGHDVDIFTRGKREVTYEGIRTHIKGDRKSIDSLKTGLEGREYDFVFDISAYTKEDVELLVSVLDRRKLKNYIFCSSGAVYEPTDDIVTEDYPTGWNHNWGDYGLNKKKAEDYLFELHKEEGFPMTIFRPTYIYGEGNNLYREGYFFDRIIKDSALPIPEGDNRVQFIYIEDLAKTFESAMHSEKAIGNAYNLTHPEEVSWETLAQSAMNAVGKQVKIKEIDYKSLGIETRNFVPFRDVTYITSIKKLGEDGLYIPQLDLKEGLARTYNWYCEEKPELEDLRMNKIEEVLRAVRSEK